MTTITAPATNAECTPAERVTRSLLGYGIIAGPMYVLISLVQGVTRDGSMTLHKDLWPGWEGEARVLKVLGPKDFAPQ